MTDKQLATVLAALRLWQRKINQPVPGTFNDAIKNMEHFMEHDPLTSEEIDELCGALNTEDNDG